MSVSGRAGAQLHGPNICIVDIAKTAGKLAIAFHPVHRHLAVDFIHHVPSMTKKRICPDGGAPTRSSKPS